MSNNVPNNEFRKYVSTDFAPENSICLWCGKKLDVKYYIVTGGEYHNQVGLFCCSCGETFTSNIEHASQEARAAAEQTQIDSYHWISRPTHIAVLSEQRVNAYYSSENNEEEIVTMEDYERWVAGRYAQ